MCVIMWMLPTDLISKHFAVWSAGMRHIADLNATVTIKQRLGDEDLRACKDRKAIKSQLL